MADWALTRTDRKGMFEGAGDVDFSFLHGDAEGFPQGEISGDGGAESASGTVGMAGVYAGVAEDI